MQNSQSSRVTRSRARTIGDSSPSIEFPSAEESVGRFDICGSQIEADRSMPDNENRFDYLDQTGLGKYVAIPEAYDGNKDFSMWLQQFEFCARANGWTEARKLTVLPTRLSGKAFMKYVELAPDLAQGYEHVKGALRKAMDPPELQGALRIEFRHRSKLASETLDEYYQQLDLLSRKAYPGMPEEAREELLKDQFLQGLPWNVRDRVLQSRPVTATQALTMAREQGAWLSMAPHAHPDDRISIIERKIDQLTGYMQQKEKRSIPIPRIDTSENKIAALEKKIDQLTSRSQWKQENSSFPGRTRLPIECWNCGRKGHRANDCRTRPNKVYQNSSTRHYTHAQRQGPPPTSVRTLSPAAIPFGPKPMNRTMAITSVLPNAVQSNSESLNY